jgi:glycosyltransferase involved in cell wall biosynthesis
MSVDHLPITIVTPVFNGAQYLESTIQSILSQNYPNLEYIIIDGGSTDGTIEIIKRYEKELTYWTSEKDGGMYDALQKGFERSTGAIMGWLNADDMHLPWTLSTVNAVFYDLPDIEWISSLRPLIWNAQGAAVECMALSTFSRQAFRDGAYTPGHRNFVEIIQQESTFWRRSLWERAGSHIDRNLRYAGDFELWARFYHHAELVGVRTVLGGFRVHGAQITAHHTAAYLNEAINSFHHHVPQSPPNNRIRSLLRPILGTRVRRTLSRFGWATRGNNAVYDLHAGRWKLRQDPL